MSERPHPNVKTYLWIFAALMVLTVVTVGVSYIHLPAPAAITLGLMIATLKAGLVAAFFMHLKGERLVIYSFLGLTVLAVVILFALPFTDSVMIDTRLEQPIAAAASHAEESH